MAYSYSVEVFTRTFGGRRHFFIAVTETDAETTSEFKVGPDADDGGIALPAQGTITSFTATTVSGRTIQTAFGNATGFDPTDADDTNFITQQAAAARTFQNDQSTVRYSKLSGGELFGQSTPDSNTTGTTLTEFVIVEGNIA